MTDLYIQRQPAPSASNHAQNPARVMIAGIGGASLGTEIFKCMRLCGGYEVYGCDVSATAYGLYEAGFARTYRVDRKDYVLNVIDACHDSGATWVIPGGEEPTLLLGKSSDVLAAAGIRLIGNSPSVIGLCTDKQATFEKLAALGIQIPFTVPICQPADLDSVEFPCIIKPSTGSGGSAAVFFALTADEALIYAEFIRRNHSVPLAQEYVDDSDGEFTVGVLSLPDGRLVGSIALRRALDAKLSVSYRGRGGVVSSGYSQGHIDEYPDICRQAEKIASVIDSRGPINVQGRVRDGVLLPFEINPRFSASTYLRALAGFNEIEMMLHFLVAGEMPQPRTIRPGYYLRSLTEVYVPHEAFK